MSFPRSKIPAAAILLLIFVVSAVVMAYPTDKVAWLVAAPAAIFGLVIAIAFAFVTLERLFGIGRRKGTPEEFARALEKHLLGEKPDPGWDDPMDVVLADPRLEQVRRRLGHNLDSLAREEDRDELRAIIDGLRRGVLPDVPRRRGIADFFHLRP